MKKRLSSLFLALALTLTLTACSGGGTPAAESAPAAAGSSSQATEEHATTGGDLTLRLAWLGNGQNKDALDACLQKYTDTTGIGVETVFIPGTWAEYFTKIQTMMAGGEKLDCAYVAIEGFNMFIDMDMAAPIDDWIAANNDEYHAVADDVAPNVLAFMNFDGKQYGIPCEYNNVVTHFNTTLLSDAGLSLPAENWDKDAFLEYCKQLTKTRDDGSKQFALAIPSYYFGFEAWLYNNGASYMNDDFTKSTLLEPASVEMFQLAQDLIYKYGYAPVPESGVDDIQRLIDGNIVMGFWGRWPTTKYIDENFKNVAVQYIPNFKQNKVIWGGAGIFSINGTEHPDEAASLSVYLASPPFIKEFMAAGAIPVLNSVASEVVPSLGFPENNKLYYESAAKAVTVQAPPQYAECSTLIERALSDILVNQADVQSTLEEADAELNAILTENA